AVWSVPVVAAAVATPLAAASTTLQVDLWSTARLPVDRDGTHTVDGNTHNYYQGPRTATFTYTFGNDGPDALPAGARIAIGLPFAAIWTTDSLTFTDQGGYVLDPVGTRTENIAVEPVAVRQLWDFVLASELASGTFFNVTFTVEMNGTSNTATDFYRVRTTSGFQPGAGVTDVDLANNSDFSDSYAFFNFTGAGG
ncbi:hypothetical protein, partial [Microbacterium sp.]|uniref:hypothetical protein n=1 Tax=Microbacterium sp. TaxID=51671 RepID=UPI0027368BE1